MSIDKTVIFDILEKLPKYYTVTGEHRMFAEIRPESKQSTRIGRYRAYTSKKKKDYVKKLVGCLMTTYGLGKAPITGPVKMSVLYCLPWMPQDTRALTFLLVP